MSGVDFRLLLEQLLQSLRLEQPGLWPRVLATLGTMKIFICTEAGAFGLVANGSAIRFLTGQEDDHAQHPNLEFSNTTLHALTNGRLSLHDAIDDDLIKISGDAIQLEQLFELISLVTRGLVRSPTAYDKWQRYISAVEKENTNEYG